MPKFKRVSKEVEDRIRKSASEGKVVMESSSEIDEFEDEWHDLARDVLGLVPEECFVSDRSSLPDFQGCGDDYDELQSPDWYEWVSQKVHQRFGITVTGHETLLGVCSMIRLAPTRLN